MFVHFELWINKREGIIPGCLVPSHQEASTCKPHSLAQKSGKGGAHSLYGTQHPHATNMRILAIHVVREDDDLENVRVDRFAACTRVDRQ